MHMKSPSNKRDTYWRAGGFFNELQRDAARCLPELFDRSCGSLVTPDSRLKEMSVADRAAFRAALDNLPDRHREAVLDQLAAFTRKTLPELVDDLWSSYILDDPDSAERRFNSTVLDYFKCCGELIDCQKVPGAEQCYGRLRAPIWYSIPVVLVIQWERESAGVVRNIIEQVEPADAKVVLVAGKGLEEPFKHVCIQAVVSYDALCSQVATHIFDNVGISWIYC